jgi:hypothetical protein
MGRGADWIDLVRKMDRWRALVNAVLNFRILYTVENFFAS